MSTRILYVHIKYSMCEKIWNKRNLYIKLHLKEDFGMEFTAG